MKICVNCGEQLPEKAKFCLNCGMAVEQQVEPPLSRSEIYKDRELNIGEDEEQASEESIRSRTTNKKEPAIKKQLLNYGKWIKRNPLTSFITVLITILIFLWINKMVGVVLLILAIICGYFYMLKVGSDNQRADARLKGMLTRVKVALENLLTRDDRNKNTSQPTEQSAPVEDSFNQTDQLQPSKKKKGLVGNRLIIVATIILMLSTYFGAFSSAVVAGFGTPTTLLSILRAIGQERLLFGILIGPVLMLFGALIKTKFIIRLGSIVNVGIYGYVFYMIYQNEAATSGWMNMIKNIHLGISGYLVIIISILVLIYGGRRHPKNKL